MPRPGCPYEKCPFDPIPVWIRLGIAFIVAASILSKPLLNGLGVQSTDAVMSAKFVMNFSFFVPVFIVMIAMGYAYFHVVEKSYFMIFCLDVAGIPGTFLAFILLAAR